MQQWAVPNSCYLLFLSYEFFYLCPSSDWSWVRLRFRSYVAALFIGMLHNSDIWKIRLLKLVPVSHSLLKPTMFPLEDSSPSRTSNFPCSLLNATLNMGQSLHHFPSQMLPIDSPQFCESQCVFNIPEHFLLVFAINETKLFLKDIASLKSFLKKTTFSHLIYRKILHVLRYGPKSSPLPLRSSGPQALI